MRLMPSSSAVHIAVWEECFFRWVLLNEMVIRDTIDSTVDGFDSGRAPIGDRAMSTEVCHSTIGNRGANVEGHRSDWPNGRT